MLILQVYIFAGNGYNRHANKFIEQVPRLDPQMEIERIEIAPGEFAQIAIVAKVRVGMTDLIWRRYVEIRGE
jgi:hypothetical protein